MTVVSYHSTLISDLASQQEAADKTSSHIFLSRGVAGADVGQVAPAPQSPSPTFVMSVLDSESSHMMSLGSTAADITSTRTTNDQAPSEHSQLDQDPVRIDEADGRMSADKPTTIIMPLESKTEGLQDVSAANLTKHIDKGKDKEAERGRPLERGPRYSNPLAKAESRPRMNDATIELDVQPIEKRQLSRSNTISNFEDPNDPCAFLEDNLLEPCPRGTICNSVSEVLSASESSIGLPGRIIHGNTWSSFENSSLNHPRPSRALTTIFSNCHPVYPAPTFHPEILSRVRPDIDQLENIAITSSTSLRSCSDASQGSRAADFSPISSEASRLPTEIVQEILYNLAPADFNSARHTCRSWFINSIHRPLLETMLRRAGFSNLIVTLTADESILEESAISAEWSMSKTLARECALGPDWTGNGLAREHTSGILQSAFIDTSRADFTEVALQYPGPFPAGTIFTISSCGRFLMIAHGCLVYLYELNRSHKVVGVDSIKIPGALRPVTSIICPRRVLACSMDTSCNRYAVALLLDGRMGLVCNISASAASSTSSTPALGIPNLKTNLQSSDATAETGIRGTSFLDRVSLRTSASASSSSQQSSKDPPFVFPGIATTGANFAPVNQSEWQDVFRDDVPELTRTAGPSSRHGSLPRARADGFEDQVEDSFIDAPERLSNSMRIENGPRSIYRNLCSDDDPPRSVAICPQRRCVAFGCSSGIELHWVDALTGQDLNRWFPLTAPSDFLFFLPPRRSIDSAKKLRLISSAGKPGERPAIAERPFGTRAKSSPFWEGPPAGSSYFDTSDVDLSHGFLTRLRGDAGRSSLTGRMDCSDHYRAIPLSDGYHILFTDPSTGLLCLGSDAPVGGPTKLLRKIWFQGPREERTPIAYSAGADLSCGIRIVAAFGNGTEQAIWLFSIPTDVFAINQGGQSPLSASSYLRSKSGQENPSSEWIKWWPDGGLQEWLDHARDPVAGILPRSVWPVKVRGQQIGTCRGLVDLTIDSGPCMAVWAFNKNGIATVWKMDIGKNESIKRRWVMGDGTIRESDGEGDIEMVDAPSPAPNILRSPMPLTQESFDGSAPFCPRVQSNAMHYDSEGEFLMDELPHSQESYKDNSGPEDHVLDQQVVPEVRSTTDGSTRAFKRKFVDLVEEVTGVARIDIEIR